MRDPRKTMQGKTMTQFSMTNSTEGCFQLRYALAGKSGLLLREMFPF